MSTVSSQDTPRNNGRPSAPASIVAIRQAVIAAEGSDQVLWHRQVPAWVISGGLHFTLISIFFFCQIFVPGCRDQIHAMAENQIVETKLEDDQQKQNFENTDVGLDPTKETNYNVDRIENISVPGIVRPDEPVGIAGARKGRRRRCRHRRASAAARGAGSSARTPGPERCSARRAAGWAAAACRAW